VATGPRCLLVLAFSVNIISRRAYLAWRLLIAVETNKTSHRWTHPTARFCDSFKELADRRAATCRTARHFGGNIAMASTSNSAPGRASCGTPTVVLAGGETVFTYVSRTSR